MPTTIQCIRGKIEENLSIGNVFFISELAKYKNALQTIGFEGIPTSKAIVQQLPATHGDNRYLVCIDNDHKLSVKTINVMRKQVFAALDAFREQGIRTVSMNGIKAREIPDRRCRPEAYQRQFVEEYIAKNPDAFDTISLVDKHGGFKDPINEIVNFFVGDDPDSRWMDSEYGWPLPPRTPVSEEGTVRRFHEFSSDLNKAIRVVGPKSEPLLMDCINDILTWGGIRDKHLLIPDFSQAIKNIGAVTDIGELLTMVRRGSSWRIASWTKILAAYKPGEFYIYDSRVAIALSYISRELGLPCFWRIPSPSEKSKQDNATIHEQQKHIAFVRFEGSLVKTLKVDNPTCYSLYLSLLKRLAWDKRIQDAYQRLCPDVRNAYAECGFNQEEAIMAHLEKMLFMQKERILAPYMQNS
jgi:hypothetical protein